eukprot:CAMPEP_0171901894 /NCGR_PEP_ID=MMETSP0993-20121228/844_1 /TAXON_ID=483369 /ORGANISM="non described non described, Strain CCMP2098" /LENGTH=72 /DNA_ID=CAMNT_0012530905 /DNA_START=331 /DNA_END=549 /DNA_ORIENTATION=-
MTQCAMLQALLGGGVKRSRRWCSCRRWWGLRACTSATAASSTAALMPSQAIAAALLNYNNMSDIQSTAQSEM